MKDNEIDKSNSPFTIDQISTLPNFNQITILSLNSCGINNLEYFPFLPSIEKIFLQNNKIEKGLSVFGDAKLVTLKTLDLSSNLVWNFLEILELQKLPNLQQLCLENCPVMETPSIMKMTFGYLFSLHTLNGKDAFVDKESDSEDTLDLNNLPYPLNNTTKQFKLYDDFSHCPIIKTQYKNGIQVDPVTIVSDSTLKRQSESNDLDEISKKPRIDDENMIEETKSSVGTYMGLNLEDSDDDDDDDSSYASPKSHKKSNKSKNQSSSEGNEESTDEQEDTEDEGKDSNEKK